MKVLAIHDAHATPMADSKHRLLCSEAILKSHYNEQLLSTAGVKYIVLAKWEVAFSELEETLRNDMYHFDLVKETHDFFIYKINTSNLSAPQKSGSCYQYQVNEKTL